MILEQNYAYDLVSPEQLYSKYIDHQIEVVDKEGNLITGRLLAHSGGALTLMEESGRVKVVMMANTTEVNFPELPEGLITRPTLFWLYSSKLTQFAQLCNHEEQRLQTASAITWPSSSMNGSPHL